jgi:hypothetical protein
MDVERMAKIVREKHGVTLHPDDSVFLLATIADELQREGWEELAKLAAGITDQVSAVLVLADTTARSRAERIVTEAARWSAEQIRTAAADAAQIVVAQTQDRIDQTKVSARMATLAACASGIFAAVCSVLIILIGR